MNRRRFVLTSVVGVPSLTGWFRRCPPPPSTTPETPAPCSIVAADIGFGVPRGGAEQGDLLFLRDGGARQLYRMAWRETTGDRPLSGESALLLHNVERNATDPRVPIRDAPFFSDSARWMIWREDATVHAEASTGNRQTLRLNETPHGLLRPSLQRSGGDVFVFALSADRTRVDQLRFPRAGASPASIAPSVALGDGVDAATVGFAGDAMRLATVRASAGTTTIRLLTFENALPPRSVAAAGATPIPDTEPVLASSATGDAVVAVLVATDTGIAIAEATFPRDRSAPTMAVRAIGRLRAAPVAGALRYRSALDAPPRVARAVVRIADGTFARLNDAGVLEPANYPAPPVVPIVLAPAVRGALILCCDPTSGPLVAEA